MARVYSHPSFMMKSMSVTALFALPIGIIFYADGILSYIFSLVMDESSLSGTMIGIVLASSSVVGIVCDNVFPQILGHKSWKYKLLLAYTVALLFPAFLSTGRLLSETLPYLSFISFLLASAAWGVYYELLSFSLQEFVIIESARKNYSKDWGFFYSIIQLVRLISPITGSMILFLTITKSSFLVMGILVIGFLITVSMLPILDKKKITDQGLTKLTNPLSEFKYWKSLGKSTYPILAATGLIYGIESVYWTIGALFGLEIFGEGKNLEWVVLSCSLVPAVLGSSIVAKINPSSGRKKLTSLSIYFGGLVLISIVFFKGAYSTLFVIALSSLFFSFAGPLNEAVYSILLERLGESKEHLLGLSRSMASFSYIVGPALAGALSDIIGFRNTFGLVGIFCIIVATWLLVVTPKKLRLHEKEIHSIV